MTSVPDSERILCVQNEISTARAEELRAANEEHAKQSFGG